MLINNYFSSVKRKNLFFPSLCNNITFCTQIVIYVFCRFLTIILQLSILQKSDKIFKNLLEENT